MARNYTTPTIKTLFFEASACAYPGCEDDLIFRDRGVSTVVAQIAHIRSERPDGPRHVSSYDGDVDGPDNLLLLCGKHHPPVDRHESKYTIEELEEWKAAQRRRAADVGGTAITDAQARAFERLSAEESQALAEVARLAERVKSAAAAGWSAIEAIEAEREAAHRETYLRMGPMYETDDEGNRKRIPQSAVQMAPIESRKFDARVGEAVEAHRETINAVLQRLREELAVLRMMSGEGLSGRADDVSRIADGLLARFGPDDRDAATAELTAVVANLWAAAHGTDAD